MSHVVSGILSKRSELVGIIELKQKEIKLLEEQVSALDVALKIFDNDIDLRKLGGKRVYKNNKLFARGELSKLVLETVRIKSMDYDELLQEIATVKSIVDDEVKVLNKVLKVALASLVKGNKLEKVDGKYYIFI
ncbi:hypothetical protein [Serratia sp. UGAL515B_01]|uniref:hypothetical protein n=1 Tax=Serratia sp. UGAL515B_01 TaxID=2986763 RepID=UPI002954D247|nr:hypothetical protein [Serratia sp. UGAL515B_01]WON75930.1 hypothetical protein OK023_11700 [Serratia sp. UGAL515B_01]